MKIYTSIIITILTVFFLLIVHQPPASAQTTCISDIQTAKVNGTMLHYFECGEGEPLIFVHGSTGDLNWAGPHALFFASDFRTISYSRRFHFPNDTPQPDEVYTLQTHVDDLASLITELGLGPVHIVGHSYGGYISLAFALEHPELVRSLVLGEPPVLPLLIRTSVGAALLESFVSRVVGPAREAYEQGEIEEGLRRFLNGVIYPGWFEELPPEVRTDIVKQAGPGHRLEILSEPSAVMPPISCNALTEFDRPTLLLTGEESPAMFFLVTAELEKCLEEESHVMVPEAGHTMFTNPSFFNDTIQAFLESQ